MTTEHGQVAFESLSYKPMEPDEEPGMPTWKVKGVVDGVSFDGEISVELDGRDVEWTGTPENAWEQCDYEFLTFVATAIFGTQAYEDARAEHGDYMS